MKKTIGLLVLAFLTGLCGCNQVKDGLIEAQVDTRDFILSQKAWSQWGRLYRDVEFRSHFARGFKAGYRNVLGGGSGCQPTLPDRFYWHPRFQTPIGQAQTHAWFDGYSHGALAARQDGFGSLNTIPISPRAKENLRIANTERTLEDIQGGGMEQPANPQAVPLLGTGNPQTQSQTGSAVISPGANDKTGVVTPPNQQQSYDNN